MAVYHETFTLDEFIAKLDSLKARGKSMFWYAFPFADKITVEFRRHNPGATGIPNRAAWISAATICGARPARALDTTSRRPSPILRFATR